MILAILMALGARAAVLPVLLTLRRADFDAFLAVKRVLFALFLTVRRTVFVERRAVFADWVLIILNIAAKFGGVRSFYRNKS